MRTRAELITECEKLGKEPQIWFQVPGYVIRNYSPDLEESVLHHMLEYFLPSEPIFSACDIINDPVSVEEVREVGRSNLKNNLTLIALTENSPGADLKPIPEKTIIPLAAVNILRLCHEKDPEQPYPDVIFKGYSLIKALKAFMLASEKINCFEKFEVPAYLRAAGLAVHPEHRKRGLCKSLLEARTPLCRKLGLTTTFTVFTSEHAQTAAASCGFQTIDQIFICDLKDENQKLMFPKYHRDRVIVLAFKTIF